MQTHPRHELEASEELGLAGFEVHLPRERISRVRIRQGKRVAETVVRPFFPGYLFVRLDLAAGWRQAAHVRGVRRLFGASPERPIPVPEGIVEALIVRADAAGVIDSQPGALRLAAFTAGAKVRVLEGPFADLTGVCQMSTVARVHLLLDAMGGRHIPIDLPRELVVAA